MLTCYSLEVPSLNLFFISIFSKRESCCYGVLVQRADSKLRGCEFASRREHNKDAIGEEGNGKPPNEFDFPRRNSEPCIWFLLRSKSSVVNTIGEEGNGKPPHEFNFPRRNSEPCIWFLLRSKSSVVNTIGEEGNGKPPHEFNFPRRNSEPCIWFLLRSKSSMQRTW